MVWVTLELSICCTYRLRVLGTGNTVHVGEHRCLVLCMCFTCSTGVSTSAYVCVTCWAHAQECMHVFSGCSSPDLLRLLPTNVNTPFENSPAPVRFLAPVPLKPLHAVPRHRYRAWRATASLSCTLELHYSPAHIDGHRWWRYIYRVAHQIRWVAGRGFKLAARVSPGTTNANKINTHLFSRILLIWKSYINSSDPVIHVHNIMFA